MSLNRRGLLLGAGTAVIAASARADGTLPLTLDDAVTQGGFAIGRTAPGAIVFLDDEALTTARDDGLFFIGFDRDEPETVSLKVQAGARSVQQTLKIQRGAFPSSRIDGLPATTVDPVDPAVLEKIRLESAAKAEGFASRLDADHFRDGFVWPLTDHRVSSPWGSQRVLNGTPARPHYGIDLAAPAGTIIRAPGDGIVTLARPDMHYEGGLVLIDHGQGLITAYLHQSRLEVAAGQMLKRGDPIGRVGMTGRATGPHLCWRMKWRDRNLDPSLMIGMRAR